MIKFLQLLVNKEKSMVRDNLSFFCRDCRCSSKGTSGAEQCSMAHSTKAYKRGEYIAYQGDTVNHLLMLVKGKVKTEIVSASGFVLSMEIIESPYPLAAPFLFADNNHFPVDIISLEDSEVMFISKPSVERSMAQCPGFLRGFMAFNANRIEYLTQRLKIFAQKGIKGKLCYYILSKEVKGSFELGRSIKSLAEYFGVERPSLSRTLSEMVQQGIITLDNGKGRILDYKKIEEALM